MTLRDAHLVILCLLTTSVTEGVLNALLVDDFLREELIEEGLLVGGAESGDASLEVIDVSEEEVTKIALCVEAVKVVSDLLFNAFLLLLVTILEGIPRVSKGIFDCDSI